MVIADIHGRAWERVEPGLMSCEDGSAIAISPDCTDEQASLSLHNLLLESARSTLDAAVERRLNATAQARGYADMQRAATYATSKIFGAEAQALIDWRDQVWLHCYATLKAVEDGQRTIPSEEELIAELPPYGGV